VRSCLSLCASLLALTAAAPAHATDYYAAPNGSGTTCSQAAPCSAATAIGKPSAGDNVYFRGGTYTSSLYINKSGTSSAWITFAAYPGELPIFQTSSGLGSNTGTYLRFVGLVSTGAATGFGNGWTGSGTTTSNGHFQFVNCIADGNTANGIAFRSATGVLISECIVAHNGSSTTASWSSGVDLYGAQGTYQDNIIERTVAFENVDNQVHTDGSGFIVDDIGTGATFVNNIGFRNGGSCIRLTTSSGTHIINNSCYHDGLDPSATNPSSPGEIFFSDPTTRNGVVMVNNLAAAAGYNGTQSAIFNAPSSTVSNNYAVDRNGATPFFNDPAGTNPDFQLTTSASVAIDQGTATEAPANDIGFDPKCITKTAPASGLSWWIYSIDYNYISSLGGVAQCFKPRTRSGTIDIGAYEYAASSSSGGTGGTGGTGGAAGNGAAAGTGGTGGISGGSGGTSGTAGTSSGSGGTTAGAGGSATSGTGGLGGGGTSSAGRGGGSSGSNSGGAASGGASGATASGGTQNRGGAAGNGGLQGAGGSVGAGGNVNAGGTPGASGMSSAAGALGMGGDLAVAGMSGGVGAAGATGSGAGTAGAPTTDGGGPASGGAASGGASGAAGQTTIGGTAGNNEMGAGTSGNGAARAGSSGTAGIASDTPDSADGRGSMQTCNCRVPRKTDDNFGLFAAFALAGVVASRRRATRRP
jgi:hypothetical protein